MEDAGVAAELVCAAQLDELGMKAELDVVFEEAADWAAEDSASKTSLLIASWLCGMSRYLLLDEKSCSLSELSRLGLFS